MDEPEPILPRVATASMLFQFVEHTLYVTLGAMLAVVALVALVHAGLDVLSEMLRFSDRVAIFDIMDELLFVLMLVEILHTVGVSIRSYPAEPRIERARLSMASRAGTWSPSTSNVPRGALILASLKRSSEERRPAAARAGSAAAR